MSSSVQAGSEALRSSEEEIRTLISGRESGREAVPLVADSIGFRSVLSRLSRI